MKSLEDLFASSPYTCPVALPGGYPEGITEHPELVADVLYRGALEMVRKHRELRCHAYVFAQRHPETLERGRFLFMTSITTPEAHDSHHAKHLFANLVRGVAHYSEALAVAVVFNAWIVLKPDEDTQETRELVSGKIRPAEHPERREIVYASLELRDGTQHVWTAPVTKYGHRGTHVGALELLATVRPGDESNSYGGHFSKMFEMPEGGW